jgi:hypothetical protein
MSDPVAAPIPSPDNGKVQAAGDAAAAARARARGLASTQLTTPATAADPVSIGRKMLLGA